jgi:hypothetical protein
MVTLLTGVSPGTNRLELKGRGSSVLPPIWPSIRQKLFGSLNGWSLRPSFLRPTAGTSGGIPMKEIAGPSVTHLRQIMLEDDGWLQRVIYAFYSISNYSDGESCIGDH